MNHWTSRVLLLVLLLSFVSPASLPPARAAAVGTRLVVFEGFYRVTWKYSQAASSVVNNQISSAYAGQPVVIIGYDTDDPNIAPQRKNRFYAAQPSPPSLPHIMTDSGQQVSSTIDFPDLVAEYRRMIDPELGRPPQAAISATYTRVGNHIQFNVQVTNQSSTALSSTNSARVHVIVYETFTNSTRPAYSLVNNFGRATAATGISPALNVGATRGYTLTTPDLPSGVVWANLRMLALVDYRPGGATGPYDMLQAAFAQSTAAPYTITPARLDFLVNSKAPSDQTKLIRIQSASSSLTWSATGNASWMSISPASGSASTPATVKVTASSLAAGSQSGTITFQITDSGGFSREEKVPVVAYLGDIRSIFLPFLRR